VGPAEITINYSNVSFQESPPAADLAEAEQ
jgi:hypothetical protein